MLPLQFPEQQPDHRDNYLHIQNEFIDQLGFGLGSWGHFKNVMECVASYLICAGKSGEAMKEEDFKAEVSSEVWGEKDEGGSTHAFVDDEKKIDFRGQDDKSVLGIGGQRAEDSGRPEN